MERRNVIIAIIIVLIVLFLLYNRPERLEVADRPTFVMFHAPWCGYCKKAMPEWERFIAEMNKHKAEGVAGHANLALLTINAEEQAALAGKHNVRGYPTILYLPHGVGNGAGTVEYRGARTAEALLSWAHSQL